MSLTHAAIAGAVVTLGLSDCSPIVLGLAIAGSQLPDLDTSTSSIGQIFFFISRPLERRFPHRTVTHSFLATAAIALFSLPLFVILGVKPWMALWAGHLVSIFSDTFTKQGVQLFYPAPVWCVRGMNPRRRLTTGGPGEYWVVLIAVSLLSVSVHLYHGGGLVTKMSQVIGIRSGQEKVYNANAGNHHVWAQVTAVRGSDRQEVSDRYWIVGQAGNEYVLTLDGRELFKTGEQLIVSRIVVEVGKAATTSARLLMFEDESPIETLKALRQSYPNSAIFLSGELDCDSVDLLKVSTDPNRYPTLVKTETSLKLSFHPLEQAIRDLKEQYASGSLTAKIVRPSPFVGRV